MPAIQVKELGKIYRLFRRPLDRLLQMIIPGNSSRHEVFVALENVSFTVARGEVVGIVGVNGAGKSTLLQLVAGIVPPTSGQVEIHGRVASILELGAGFNPEFSGRENIYLNAATMGLSKSEIDKRLDAIIEFAGIGPHIEQPVKTYSSGMVVRLAFSIASSVDPDILIVDEALSVGDGAFRRKSFDRIMEIKTRGVTILFCSHVLFHIETFCSQVIWLHKGRMVKAGRVDEVIKPYQEFLDIYEKNPSALPADESERCVDSKKIFECDLKINDSNNVSDSVVGEARFKKVKVILDGLSGTELRGKSLESKLIVQASFKADVGLPAPTLALVISSNEGKIIGSCSSLTHKHQIEMDGRGNGLVTMTLNPLPLNRGKYRVGVYLFCERGIHGYDMFDPAATIELEHIGPEQGPWILEPHWDNS